MRINFFGDFVAPSVEKLAFSKELNSLIHSSDINVVNCEAVAIDRNCKKYKKIKKSGPNIHQDPEVPRWLISKGFNVISLANNHVMDYGEQALRDTIFQLPEENIMGAGNWEQAYRPLIIEVHQKRIAFLALTHCEFGTLTDSFGHQTIGAAWINHPDVDNIISKTRQNVDFLFVYAHAGVEHFNQPLPEWRERYRAFINLGCDAIVASHPHTVQGWEFYNGKPIVYSLGNFYFPKKTSQKSWYQSIVATLHIEDDIKLEVTSIKFRENNIETDVSKETKTMIEKLNYTLGNHDQYMTEINHECINRMETFYTMFQNGGLSRSYTLKKNIRSILSLIRGRIKYNPAWLCNNMQCESHRWMFVRGFKLINHLE